MNIRELNDGEILAFFKQIHDRLAAHEVTSLDNALADALAAILAPIIAAFEARLEALAAADAAKQAATQAKNASRALGEDACVDVLNNLKAVRAPGEDYEICGFDAPSTTVSGPYQAQTPSNFAALGASNGVNTMQWDGNNKHGMVTYEIWRREGDEGPWLLRDTTKRQDFKDTPVTPGQYYEYKCRAKAATNLSEFSNTSVVYGAP